MAASYPGAIKTFSAVVNGVTKLVAALFNSPYDEVTAIETELGTDVAGSKDDLKARLAVALNDDGTLKNICWVAFNGTGTPSIIADKGVASITDNGTGDYTITFDAAFADANYFVSGICGVPTSGYVSIEAIAADTLRIKTYHNGDTAELTDFAFISVVAIKV